MAIKKIVMSKRIVCSVILSNTPFIYNCVETCSLLLREYSRTKNIVVFNGGVIGLSVLKIQLEAIY
jgi:hypothetical protein